MKIPLFLLLLIAPIKLIAAEYTSADDIKNAIEVELKQQFSKKVQFDIGHIDSRLKLKPCAMPLNVTVKDNKRTSRLLVSVRCETEQYWKIFVPVRLKRLATVVVANRQLSVSHCLTLQDVHLEEREIISGSSGFVTQLSEVEGMVLKRVVNDGAVLKFNMMKLPIFVKKGEMVQIIAEKGQFKVQMPGIAQKNAKLDEAIPVKNMHTNKLVIAKITARGVAHVDL